MLNLLRYGYLLFLILPPSLSLSLSSIYSITCEILSGEWHLFCLTALLRDVALYPLLNLMKY
jgi:hypothetical protein